MRIHTHKTFSTMIVVGGECLFCLGLLAVVEVLGWVLCPFPLDRLDGEGFARVVTQQLPGLQKTILYDKDRYGLRALSPVAPVKPPNLLRILCLGASTTDQSTQNTPDTWCGILETELLRHYRPLQVPIQTLAFGRSGLRAADDAFWAQEMFAQLQPDVVITILGINDLVWNGGPTYHYQSLAARFAQQAQARDLVPARPGGLKAWCTAYSQLCRRLVFLRRQRTLTAQLQTGAVVEWHSAHLANLRQRYQTYPSVTDLRRQPDPLDEFREALQWLITFFTTRHVPMIVLGQPVLWKDGLTPEEFHSLWFAVQTPQGPVRPSGAWLHREMARYNAVQQALAAQAGIQYINLDDKIPKTLAYYFDDCHVTDLGSRAVAEHTLPVVIQVIEEIRRQQGLSQRKPL